MEGSRALRKTAFPPLNTSYSSSVFTHLAADKTEKFSFLCTKIRTTAIILSIFYPEEISNPLNQKGGLRAASHTADGRAPTGSQQPEGSTVGPRLGTVTLSHSLQGCNHPPPLCPPTGHRGGQPTPQPLL